MVMTYVAKTIVKCKIVIFHNGIGIQIAIDPGIRIPHPGALNLRREMHFLAEGKEKNAGGRGNASTTGVHSGKNC